jgi:periplasmic mercuric ion binding protein
MKTIKTLFVIAFAVFATSTVNAGDINSQTLRVTYDRSKLNLVRIEQIIAAAGHDTEKIKAQDNVYTSLPECCHYQRKS